MKACEILDVLLTVCHGTLRNQHQLGTLFLGCLLGFSAFTCVGLYTPIFRKLCTVAILCNGVCRMRVDCVQTAVEPQQSRNQHASYKRNYTK
jgi:hypothetical protein